MHTSKLTITLATLAAAGGAAWLAKFAVIAATDGADAGGADAATVVLYLAGVVLMLAGPAAAGVSFAGPRRAARVGAMVLAVPAFFVSFVVLEGLAKAAVGDAGPVWLSDEAGIALTGAFWLATGLALRSRAGLGVSAPTPPADRAVA